MLFRNSKLYDPSLNCIEDKFDVLTKGIQSISQQKETMDQRTEKMEQW